MLASLLELERAGRGTSGRVGGSSLGLGLGSSLGDPLALSLVAFRSLGQGNKRSDDIGEYKLTAFLFLYITG